MIRSALSLLTLGLFSSAVAQAAPDQWIQASGDHFVVTSNANEKQVRHLVDQFERMRWVFKTLFPKTNTDPSLPIQVFAGKNERTFQSVEPAAYLAKGQTKLAGYFLGDQDTTFILLRMDVENEHPYSTVYHEYTHLQFRSAGEWMPIWLNEGLAEFFQNTDVRDKEVHLGQPSEDDLLFLRQQSLIPLPVLFRVDSNSPYYHQEQKSTVFYAESWALTHYIMITDHEQKTDRLTRYMNLMAQHQDSVAAAESAFGDLKKLQSGLDAYVRASTYKEFVMNSAAAPIDETSYKVRPISQADADLARAVVLPLVGRQAEGQAILDAALKADPNNARAYEIEGDLEFRAGNHDAARKSYEEAVKLNSDSMLAHYHFAELSLHTEGSDNPAIETSLRRVISENPRFAAAYDCLGSYYMARHERLDEALTLAAMAVRLEPANLYYRLNAANIEIARNRFEEASGTLQAALKVARTPSERNMLQSHMDQLASVRKAMEQAKALAEAPPATPGPEDVSERVEVVRVSDTPAHPDEANGPSHSLLGFMQGVTCSYPSVIEMRIVGLKGAVKVYNNNFSKIDLTVVGFDPGKAMNPCKDFEGKRARVQYSETTNDKTVDGKVTGIELRK